MLKPQPKAKSTVLTLKDAVLTYRYLRITMLAVLVMLGVSVVWYALGTECGLDSVSAYYYTPVRNVFVGALVAFGAALIAYHGNTPEEEALLNLAGCMSLVVAFVPTVPASCDAGRALDTAIVGSGAVAADSQDPASVATIVDAAVTNNVWSLIAAAVVAFALIGVLKFWAAPKAIDDSASAADDAVGGRRRAWHEFWTTFRAAFAARWTKYGRPALIAVCVAIPGAGAIAFVSWSEWFAATAHGIAAIVLVVALILYMICNAIRGGHSAGYRWTYRILAGTLIAALGLLLGIIAAHGLNRAIFYLEFLILGIFAVYWMVQSVELRGQTTQTQQ